MLTICPEKFMPSFNKEDLVNRKKRIKNICKFNQVILVGSLANFGKFSLVTIFWKVNHITKPSKPFWATYAPKSKTIYLTFWALEHISGCKIPKEKTHLAKRKKVTTFIQLLALILIFLHFSYFMSHNWTKYISQPH